MGGHPLQPTLTLPAADGPDTPLPLLLVDGHNLLWGATFGFPAPIYSRDKTRLLTGLFALLRVATLVATTPEPREVIILSRDRDYYQLITHRVPVLNTKFRAGHKLVTPAQWADFRALAGDPADDIPGVRGIGAKTAAALLEGGLTLEDLPTSGRLATGRGRAVTEQFDLALKWREMIRLDSGLDLPRWPTGQASPPLPRPADVVAELRLW